LLADWLAGQGGRVLSGYMPMRTEIDPLPAMAAHRGPVGRAGDPRPAMPLKFREWTPGCALVPGDFGALIPAEGAWLEPEVLIVPLLAFDARGYRLGYGGGFYDRTLEERSRREPEVVAPRDEVETCRIEKAAGGEIQSGGKSGAGIVKVRVSRHSLIRDHAAEGFGLDAVFAVAEKLRALVGQVGESHCRCRSSRCRQ
jgi:5,10-methenyltetrahydrofolate synthetase